MRATWIVAVVCLVLLGGAWVASRLLLNDVPVPVLPPPSALPVVAAPVDPPMKNAVVRSPALARLREPGVVAPQVGQALPQQVGSTERPAVAEGSAPSLPADEAPSPFQGASAELDYAEGLLGESVPNKERLASAHDVFKRCVEQEPLNQRCHRALVVARDKLGLRSDQSIVGKTVDPSAERKTLPPSSRDEDLSRIRPAALLK